MRARSLCIDGADSTSGSISWLIKDVNYDGILGTLKQYHDLITMVTGVPNMTDEAFSNADNASALGTSSMRSTSIALHLTGLQKKHFFACGN